jgi:hypothetical protein
MLSAFFFPFSPLLRPSLSFLCFAQAWISQDVRHKYVVRTNEFIENRTCYVLVMEYVAGEGESHECEREATALVPVRLKKIERDWEHTSPACEQEEDVESVTGQRYMAGDGCCGRL